MTKIGDSIPLPPYEYRVLVGPTEPELFDNPQGTPVFGGVPLHYYRTFFDFGCGCGRVARQLAQQTQPPERYLGIDLHQGMIEWCQQNITPIMPQFEFQHHDVFYANFNPQSKNGKTLPFPSNDKEFSFVIAISVFTHLEEDAAAFYMKEVARIMAEDSIFVTSWFVFDKSIFPMMQTSQNALYINPVDPVNAVIFDREWIREEARKNGLKITLAAPPTMRGGQWVLIMKRLNDPDPEAAFIDDLAPIGSYYVTQKEDDVALVGHYANVEAPAEIKMPTLAAQETLGRKFRRHLRPVEKVVKRVLNHAVAF
jgi:SAM-dependent methyltransferase